MNQFLSALEGELGWAAEGIAILLLVVFVNYFLKKFLLRLHEHFTSQARSKRDIWKDTFVMGMIQPLTSFVWYIAFVQTLNFIWVYLLKRPLIISPHALLTFGGLLFFGWFLLRWKKMIVNRLLESIDGGKIDALNKIATLAIYFVIGMLLLEQSGSNMNTLLAFGGVSGLAIAFASQQIIANFFGGILIYFTHPFTVGDWITLPEKNVEGHVEEIGWYTTRVRTFDKRPLYIPNTFLTNIIVTNPSRMSHRRFKERVTLRFSDIPKLPAIIRDLKKFLFAFPAIDKHLPPQVYFVKFGSSGIEVEITAYTIIIDNNAFAEITQDLLFGISKTVFDNGADFAIPKTTLEVPQGVEIP